MKSCGIHVDQRSAYLVALDGSPKKHRLVAYASAELDGEDPAAALVDFLRGTAKKHKLSVESIGLAVDSGAVSFRTLGLPFDDRAKIEEVLKFEVESDLPQFDIDQVVIDFVITDSKPGVSSELLVTAVPKDRLAARLAACEKAGLEAEEAEIDGTALFHAALESGVLDAEKAHLLVHVGDASTVVVVADGGKLVGMRAIRAGGRPATPPPAAPAEGEEPPAEDAPAPQRDPAQDLAEAAQTAARIRREIVRTLSGARLAHPLEAIHVSGRPLAGIDDPDTFEVPVVALRVTPGGSDQPLPSEAAVAYGAALRALGGGVLRPHLRREELRFTGTFERLELPLAVALLLGFFLLLVVYVVTDQKLRHLDVGDPARGFPGDMQIWLQASNAYMLPNPSGGYAGRLENPPTEIETYARRAERGEITDRPVFDQMGVINRMLESQIRELEVSSGLRSGDGTTQPQSALQASTLVMQVLDELGPKAGRFAVRSMEASTLPGRGGSGESVLVKLDIDFHGEDDLAATQHYTDFANALQAAPWCVEFERKPTKVFEDGKGIYIEGLAVRVDLSKLPQPEEDQA